MAGSRVSFLPLLGDFGGHLRPSAPGAACRLCQVGEQSRAKWVPGAVMERARFRSLDVFRGMAICLMIIVNTPGTGSEPWPVLDFLLAHEDLLLGFCEAAGTDPKAIHMARHRLDGTA